MVGYVPIRLGRRTGRIGEDEERLRTEGREGSLAKGLVVRKEYLVVCCEVRLRAREIEGGARQDAVAGRNLGGLVGGGGMSAPRRWKGEEAGGWREGVPAYNHRTITVQSQDDGERSFGDEDWRGGVVRCL